MITAKSWKVSASDAPLKCMIADSSIIRAEEVF